jgi:hypothetical protein
MFGDWSNLRQRNQGQTTFSPEKSGEKSGTDHVFPELNIESLHRRNAGYPA